MFMGGPENMAERQGRILAELSELGLGLARDLQARALAAEDPKAAADLGLAFHRISRSVRQSLALEARLQRERGRDERELAREAASRPTDPAAWLERPVRDLAAIERRKAQVRAQVLPRIEEEVEDEEHADYLTDLLDERLEAAGRVEGFLRYCVQHQVRLLCADFGLTPPERVVDGEDLDDGWIPEPEPVPPPDSG